MHFGSQTRQFGQQSSNRISNNTQKRPNFLFFFVFFLFFFAQIHTPQLHPGEWNQNQASPEKHEVTDPKRAPLPPTCLRTAWGGGEHEKLRIAHPNSQSCWAAACPCVTIPRDATSGTISETMLLHPPNSLENTSRLPLHCYTKKITCSTEEFHKGEVVFSPPDHELPNRHIIIKIFIFFPWIWGVHL